MRWKANEGVRDEATGWMLGCEEDDYEWEEWVVKEEAMARERRGEGSKESASMYDDTMDTFQSDSATHQPNMYHQPTRDQDEDAETKVRARKAKVAAWLQERQRQGGRGEENEEEEYDEAPFEVEVEGRKFEVSVGKGVLAKARAKERGEGKGGTYLSSTGLYRSSLGREERARGETNEGGRGEKRELGKSKGSATAAEGGLQGNTAYKPVGKKVHPVARAFTTDESTQLFRPPFSRDPYQTPLVHKMPQFEYGGRLSKERVESIDFGPEGWLSSEERNLLLGVLRLREKAISGSAEERGSFKSSYIEPIKIVTVPHDAWKDRPIPLPAALREPIIALLKERLESGLYEPSNSAYSSRWFVVKKKNGKLRIVHDLQRLNGVTVRNSGRPPHAEEFIESFAGRTIYALLDLDGGYDQVLASETLRDLTTFYTFLGPLRLKPLPQGWTNSPAEFQRLMDHLIFDEIPEYARAFLDDLGIKGPSSRYSDERLAGNPGIRRFVWEFGVTLERLLFRLEEAGATVGIGKMQLGTKELELLGMKVSYEGTSITKDKLNKISAFPEPKDVKELRSFLGLVNYLKIFVPRYSEVTAPLRELLRKDVTFEFTKPRREAFLRLKSLLGHDILLKKIDYGEGAGDIVLAVDSSYIAAGGALFQEDEERIRQPARYESISFTPTESRYSQPKLELAGVTKMLKRLQYILWGVHFYLEVDASALVQMINRPEVPNSAMNRWLAFIHLFDFTIRHVPGKEHALADALSRARRTDDDSEAVSLEELLVDVGEFRSRRKGGVWRGFEVKEGAYEGWWAKLAQYLGSAERPEGMAAQEYRRLRLQASKFFVKDEKIYRKRENGQHQEVVMKNERREEFMKGAHEETGHRGGKETHRRVVERAWWPGVEKEVKEWVKTCDSCQRYSTKQERELGRITLPAGIIDKWHFDCAYLKIGSYIVEARDDLSGWSEGRALKKLSARAVGAFLEEEIISRFGQFRVAVVDGGSEFKERFAEILRRAGIQRVVIAPYHPEANGRIERAHQSIIAFLGKAAKSSSNLKSLLHHALLADRISTSRSTGYSPFELLYGARPILPIDVSAHTWLVVEWEKVSTREELLKARLQLLDRKGDLEEKALRKMEKARQQSLVYYDKVNAHRIRQPLAPGQLVLVLNQLRLDSHTGKLDARWHGPLRVKMRLPKGSYLLEELDGAVLGRAYASKRLKRYWARGRREEEVRGEELGDGGEADEEEAGEEDEVEARREAAEEVARHVEEQRKARAADNDEKGRKEKRKEGRAAAKRKFWVEVPPLAPWQLAVQEQQKVDGSATRSHTALIDFAALAGDASGRVCWEEWA